MCYGMSLTGMYLQGIADPSLCGTIVLPGSDGHVGVDALESRRSSSCQWRRPCGEELEFGAVGLAMNPAVLFDTCRGTSGSAGRLCLALYEPADRTMSTGSQSKPS